jgi:hypothetical protein
MSEISTAEKAVTAAVTADAAKVEAAAKTDTAALKAFEAKQIGWAQRHELLSGSIIAAIIFVVGFAVGHFLH